MVVSFLGSFGRRATSASVKSSNSSSDVKSSDVKEKAEDGFPSTATKDGIVTEDELVEGGLTFEQGAFACTGLSTAR